MADQVNSGQRFPGQGPQPLGAAPLSHLFGPPFDAQPVAQVHHEDLHGLSRGAGGGVDG